MLNIFISYRRQDTSGYAVHLRHALPAYLSPGSRVFMDVDSIPPGVDFREHIKNELEMCNALLVLIGDEWLITRDKRERLSDETDHVRAEITEALGRSGIPVIPILVERAVMPRPDELPSGLRDLAYRNAFEISDRSAEADVRRLGEYLAALDKQAPSRAQPLPQQAPPRPRSGTKRETEGRIFADATVPGQELLAAHEAGTLEYRAIGRGRGGVNGAPYKNDLETGAWRTQPYKVSRLPEAAQQVNWFGMDRFIEDVTAAESATPARAPAAPDPPPPPRTADSPQIEAPAEHTTSAAPYQESSLAGIPSRITENWLASELPKFGREQLVAFVKVLRGRQWREDAIYDYALQYAMDLPKVGVFPGKITSGWIGLNVPLMDYRALVALVLELKLRRWSVETIRKSIEEVRPLPPVQIPARVTTQWLDGNVPLLRDRKLSELANLLEMRGWSDIDYWLTH